MKIAKLIIGILSCLMFLLIIVQSCTVYAANSMDLAAKRPDYDYSINNFIAVCILIAGIVGMATRSSKGGGITAGVFYAIGGLVGIGSIASFDDLQIWPVLSLIFAVVFILGSIHINTRAYYGAVSSNKKCRQCGTIYYSSLSHCPKCNFSLYEETKENIENANLITPPINKNTGDTWTCKNCKEINQITVPICKGCGSYK
jgi:uncharacterized membrane protein